MLGGIGLVWHAEKNPSNLNDLQIPLFFHKFRRGGGKIGLSFFGGAPPSLPKHYGSSQAEMFWGLFNRRKTYPPP